MAIRHFDAVEFQLFFSDLDQDGDGLVSLDDLRVWNNMVDGGLKDVEMTMFFRAAVATGRVDPDSLEGQDEIRASVGDSIGDDGRASFTYRPSETAGLERPPPKALAHDGPGQPQETPLFFFDNQNPTRTSTKPRRTSMGTRARQASSPALGTRGIAASMSEELVDEKTLLEAVATQKIFGAKLVALTLIFGAIKHPLASLEGNHVQGNALTRRPGMVRGSLGTDR